MKEHLEGMKWKMLRQHKVIVHNVCWREPWFNEEEGIVWNIWIGKTCYIVQGNEKIQLIFGGQNGSGEMEQDKFW